MLSLVNPQNFCSLMMWLTHSLQATVQIISAVRVRVRLSSFECRTSIKFVRPPPQYQIEPWDTSRTTKNWTRRGTQVFTQVGSFYQGESRCRKGTWLWFTINKWLGSILFVQDKMIDVVKHTNINTQWYKLFIRRTGGGSIRPEHRTNWVIWRRLGGFAPSLVVTRAKLASFAPYWRYSSVLKHVSDGADLQIDTAYLFLRQFGFIFENWFNQIQFVGTKTLIAYSCGKSPSSDPGKFEHALVDIISSGKIRSVVPLRKKTSESQTKFKLGYKWTYCCFQGSESLCRQVKILVTVAALK